MSKIEDGMGFSGLVPTKEEKLIEDQAIELQKRQTRIYKLEEAIKYALSQKELDYGMTGKDVFEFKMRKVFSILEEGLKK
jgi:hypothetical protein